MELATAIASRLYRVGLFLDVVVSLAEDPTAQQADAALGEVGADILSPEGDRRIAHWAWQSGCWIADFIGVFGWLAVAAYRRT